MQGIDILLSKGVDFESARLAVSTVMQVPLENFWNGDTDDVAERISATSHDAWVIYWATDYPDFPLKFDLYVVAADALLAKLPHVRMLLSADIAAPDDDGADPDQIILFGAGGVQQTAYLRDV